MTELTKEDISGMIADCINVLNIPKHRGGPGFTTWEQEFVLNIETHFKERDLSTKQIEKLEVIWEKI